jgi:hypothetical protein
MMLLAAVAAAVQTAPSAPKAMDAFRPLLGQWRCAGTFANGKPIAAHLAITADTATGSLMVRHDDLPPNSYHSLELWGPAAEGYRATIADSFDGVRWLTSSGWQDGALQWVRREDGHDKEIFRYDHLTAKGFAISWFVVRANGQPVLGDSVTCAAA